MLTQDHLKLDVSGLCVQDAVVMLQLIRRLVKSGVMEEHELPTLSATRAKLVSAVELASGVNYDVAVAQAQLVTGAPPAAPAVPKDFLSTVPNSAAARA